MSRRRPLLRSEPLVPSPRLYARVQGAGRDHPGTTDKALRRPLLCVDVLCSAELGRHVADFVGVLSGVALVDVLAGARQEQRPLAAAEGGGGGGPISGFV